MAAVPTGAHQDDTGTNSSHLEEFVVKTAHVIPQECVPELIVVIPVPPIAEDGVGVFRMLR